MKKVNIEAVFFDFGDTLVVMNPSREALFMQASNSIGLSLSVEAVRKAYQIIDSHNRYSSVAIFDQQHREKFYARYNGQLCETLAISSYFEVLQPELVSCFTKQKKWELATKGVAEGLRSLKKQGIKLGIVSNWDNNLNEIINDLGLTNIFDCVIASQETGIEEPDPRIFDDAFKQIGADPKTSLYLGNDYALDVVCARAAGITPVLIDRNGIYPHADCSTFASVQDWVSFIREKDYVLAG